ncbi:MAG: hypothetical protein ACJAUP_002495 [Cellvibrionaceae bacterium]|jgi:hypothetical protein
MSFQILIFRPISAILLCCAGMAGCTLNASNETTKNIPVSWDTGFTMPGLLASSDIVLNRITDLQKLITAPWYAAIDVSQTKVGETTFSSCAEYFDKAELPTRTTRDNEMNAYLEFKVMCEATKILMDANESQESFLLGDVLNDNSPKLWPKELSLKTSTEESKRNALNPELKAWNDVTPIIKYESQSETKSTYFHESGYQEVEIVGHGDVNHDRVEDVVIVVRDHVEGGNYFNLRLFVLSVDSQGSWELIKGI